MPPRARPGDAGLGWLWAWHMMRMKSSLLCSACIVAAANTVYDCGYRWSVRQAKSAGWAP